jgi:hypothetical protein
MRLLIGAISCLLVSLAAVAPLSGFAPEGAQPEAAQAQRRFVTLDVFVDAGAAKLGAYQVELKAGAAAAKLVGVEGGEHAAFSQPPYYDPAALHEDQLKERIVLAAFSTDAELPTGRTRVARLHVQVTGDGAYEAKLLTAGAREGERIEAKVEVVPVR